MADEMRPEVRKAAEESWKRNEAGYRFLGAMEEAEKQHLERAPEVIQLTNRDRDHLLDAIDDKGVEPNEALKRAAKRSMEIVRDGWDEDVVIGCRPEDFKTGKDRHVGRVREDEDEGI